MSTPKIAIVDYGVGNLFNVQRAIQHVGGRSEILRDPKAILASDKLLLPGVGSFEAGMESLRKEGLAGTAEEFRKAGKPILGICLGMQLLMTESEENGHHAGLNLIGGRVVRFHAPSSGDKPFKIPQIAWNTLERAAKAGWEKTILAGISEGAYMYFNHSYCVQVADAKDSLAVTSYGKDRFTSVLYRENVSGCQFHPERSGAGGLALLKNFVQG